MFKKLLSLIFIQISIILSYLLAMLARIDHGNSDGDGHPAEERSDEISYDTSLPAQHSYLGNDLEELSGRTILEDDQTLRLPLLVLPNVVLIPGQKLPLQLLHPATVSMMQHIIENDRTFGLINQRQMEGIMDKKPSIVGTTAEVRSYKEIQDEDTGFTMLRVLTEGSQRFHIEETWRQSDGILMGKVRILPEVVLGKCLDGVQLATMQRFPSKPLDFNCLGLRQELQTGRCILTDKPTRKHDRWSCANFTWWPPWVYEQYDTDILMHKIKHEICSWNSRLRLDMTPTDPTAFSYWVATNIPIDDNRKLGLLSLNCTVQRLRSELSILKRYIVLRCRECNEQIAEKKDMFSMSLEGPQGTYVNPNGHVHETITVYRATGLSLRGRPSAEHSWFPGYAWIIAECHRCSNHMGWKFVTSNKKLRPEKFWGICRSSVESGTQDDSESNWVPDI